MANVASLDHSKRNPAMRFLNRFQKNIGLWFRNISCWFRWIES
jgi:hypothetical protein